MIFLDQLQTYLDSLDNKTWYRAIGIYVGFLLLLSGGILYLYYRASSKWVTTLDTVNEDRIKTRSLLKKAQRVYAQRAEVNKLIQEDPDFKIAGYLQEVMAKTGIASALNTINTTQIDREENYRENSATVTFTGTSMRQLTVFLQAIDQNKRLYVKELDISKSKKTPRTIDVIVVITTMLPRQTSPV